MRYIRTKDGRIIDVSNMQEYVTDDENNNRIFDGYGRWSDLDDGPVYYPTEDILKQVDTIEELCDEFVVDRSEGVFDKFNRHISFETLKEARDEKECLINDHGFEIVPIFGAIWTVWGLKYVARMNEKGELCLI